MSSMYVSVRLRADHLSVRQAISRSANVTARNHKWFHNRRIVELPNKGNTPCLRWFKSFARAPEQSRNLSGSGNRLNIHDSTPNPLDPLDTLMDLIVVLARRKASGGAGAPDSYDATSFLSKSMALEKLVDCYEEIHDKGTLVGLGDQNLEKRHRRIWQDMLAYLSNCCTIKGSTVTAIGIENKNGKVLVHAAITGKAMKSGAQKRKDVQNFLERTIGQLSIISKENKKQVEKVILQNAIALATSGEYGTLKAPAHSLYQRHLKKFLGHPLTGLNSQSVLTWLQALVVAIENKKWFELVVLAYEGHKSMLHKIRSPQSHSINYMKVLHLLKSKVQQIGGHQAAVKIVCNSTLLLNFGSSNSWLQGAKVIFHDSSTREKRVLGMVEGEEQSNHELVDRNDLQHPLKCRSELDTPHTERTLEKTRNMRVLPRTLVHAELILVNYFDSKDKTFYANDPYISCSIPACSLCSLYIRALNKLYLEEGRTPLVEPRVHEHISLGWRPPPILHKAEESKIQTQRRNVILKEMINTITATLKQKIEPEKSPRSTYLSGIFRKVDQAPIDGEDSFTVLMDSDKINRDVGGINAVVDTNRENASLIAIEQITRSLDEENTRRDYVMTAIDRKRGFRKIRSLDAVGKN